MTDMLMELEAIRGRSRAGYLGLPVTRPINDVRTLLQHIDQSCVTCLPGNEEIRLYGEYLQRISDLLPGAHQRRVQEIGRRLQSLTQAQAAPATEE